MLQLDGIGHCFSLPSPSALPPFRPLAMYELLKDERVDNDVNVLECRDVNRMPRCWRITTGDLPWPAWWRAA